MTFNHLFYMFATCERYFPVVLNAVHRLTEMDKLPHENTDIHVSSYVFL